MLGDDVLAEVFEAALQVIQVSLPYRQLWAAHLRPGCGQVLRGTLQCRGVERTTLKEGV